MNKYNNTYHIAIKMKPVDIKSSIYIDSNKENFFRISKFKYNIAKDYVPNWSEEVSVIKNVKNTVSWTYVISDLNVKKLLELFTKNSYKEQIKNYLKLKKQ